MRAIDGEDVRVNAKTIEMRLADIWRQEQENEEHAVTRAALWNVVAHTWNADEHARATDVLARASVSVPQRTIVIRADPGGKSELSSWISANCHIVGGGRQVCSEEVNIVAAGERVQHVPPLVQSLLLPDMPVAMWWLGDLPHDHHDYVWSLLDPADRLIVDSSHFDSLADLELVSRIAEETITAPADLNWVRLDEWRAATAAVFDPAPMRERLRTIRSVRLHCGRGSLFGEMAEALLYVGWISAQTAGDIPFELVGDGRGAGLRSAELHFHDGTGAMIRRDPDRGVVVTTSGGTEAGHDAVTRSPVKAIEHLVVRLLQRPEADAVYVKALRAALSLAGRIS
jgi:glucose-6-phosphate dehydrogenase assembly protein OpcA